MKQPLVLASRTVWPLGLLLLAAVIISGCTRTLPSLTSLNRPDPTLQQEANLPFRIRRLPHPPVTASERMSVEHATINVPD